MWCQERDFQAEERQLDAINGLIKLIVAAATLLERSRDAIARDEHLIR